MAPSLSELISSLSSERHAERIVGIDSCRELFSKPRLLRELQGQDVKLLQVFQAHFSCVLMEKQACSKKAGAAGAGVNTLYINRLANAARSLRWVVETTLECFERKSVKAIVTHVLDMLDDSHEQLVTIIALDYFKMLRSVLEHPPHCNAIEPQLWIDSARICFNAVLRYPLRDDLPRLDTDEGLIIDRGDDYDADSLQKEPLGARDIEEMACIDLLMGAFQAPFTGFDNVAIRLLQRYAQFFHDYPTESTTHLPALSGLNKLLREVQFNQRGVVSDFAALHWNTLACLWDSKSRAVKEQLVIAFRILLPYLAAPTPGPSRSKAAASPSSTELLHLLNNLHRQLHRDAAHRFSLGPLDTQDLSLQVASRYDPDRLFSYRTFGAREHMSSSAALSWAALELGSDLVWRILRLQLTRLNGSPGFADDRGEQIGNTQPKGPTKADGRKRGRNQSIEKGTPGPSRITITIEDSSDSLSASSPTPMKRRRFALDEDQDVLSNLFRALRLLPGDNVSKSRASRLWTVQTILFLIARYWSKMPLESQEQAYSRLSELVNDEDTKVQAWTLICLSMVAVQPHENDSGEIVPKWMSSLNHLWTLCCRRICIAAVSRQAAVTATAILESDKLEKSQYLAELRSIFSALDITAPPSPTDAVCQFFAHALRRCASDIALSRFGCGAKTVTWLQTNWPLWQPSRKRITHRAHPTLSDPLNLVRLLGAICKAQPLAQLSLELGKQPALPATALVTQVRYEVETVPIATYLLEAEILDDDQIASGSAVWIASPFEPFRPEATDLQTGIVPPMDDSTGPVLSDRSNREQDVTTSRPLRSVELKISSLLKKHITKLGDYWAEATNWDESDVESDSPAIQVDVEQIQESLNLAVIALHFEASLRSACTEGDGDLYKLALELLSRALAMFARREDWKDVDVVLCLKLLDSVLGSQFSRSPTKTHVATCPKPLTPLVSPSTAAGVRQEVLAQQASDIHDSAALINHRKFIWEKASRQTKKAIIKSLKQCLSIICDGSSGTDQEASRGHRNNDDWGAARRAKGYSASAMRPSDEAGLEEDSIGAAVAVCIRGIIELTQNCGQAAPLNELVEDILQDQTDSGLRRAIPAVALLISQHGILLSEDFTSALLSRLGIDFLADYANRSDERAQLLCVDMLAATMPSWQQPEAAGTELGARSKEFTTAMLNVVRKGRPSPWRVKARVSAFAERLAASGITQRGWTDDGSSTCSSALIMLLYRAVRDDDSRIRFAVSPLIASILALAPVDHIEQLYDELSDIWSSEAHEYEFMMTRLLVCANIMISSSPSRSPAFFHLIEPCVGCPEHLPWLFHAQVLLEHVAAKIGFARADEMFKVFAAQITFGLVQAEINPTEIPFSILGYPSSRQCLESNFKYMGPMMGAIGVDSAPVKNQLHDLSRYLRKTKSQGIWECMPAVTAIEVVITVKSVSNAPDTIVNVQALLDTLRDKLTSGPDALAEPTVLDDTYRLALDEIIIAILAQFWEKDCGSDSDFVKALAGRNAYTAAAFCEMASGISGGRTETLAHIPHKPVADGLHVYDAVMTLSTLTTEASDRAAAYHVIQGTLMLIRGEKLVNDQHRHFDALRLYVAMKRDIVRSNRVLLQTLMHGLIALMGKVDLLMPVSGLMEWCLNQCLALERPPFNLANLLIVLGDKVDIAMTVARKLKLRSKEELQSEEIAISEWMESQLSRMLAKAQTCNAARDAICAYPRAFSDARQSHFAEEGVFTLTNITQAIMRNSVIVLNDNLLTRIRVALTEEAQSNPESEAMEVFARSTIWHVLSHLPPSMTSDRAVQVAKTFADVLSLLDIKIRTPTAAHLQAQDVILRDGVHMQLLEMLFDKAVKPSGPIRAFVVLQILETTRSEDLDAAKEAFSRLKAILTLQREYAVWVHKWPDSILDELDFVSEYTADLIGYPPKRVTNFISGPNHGFDTWICRRAASICDFLAGKEPDSMWVQVRQLVAVNVKLATALFPALLHLVLHDDSSEKNKLRNNDEVENDLRKALQDDQSDRRIWRSIIQAVLYLRKRNCLDFAPAVAVRSRFLGAQFGLLAQRAVTCELYSTGLLFLELNRDLLSESGEHCEDPQLELFYDIYSNIEDPDSFYAISSPDLQDSLIRRLHHEGDWGRAFELHAANFESSLGAELSLFAKPNLDHLNLSSALQGLGFNRLAGAMGEELGDDKASDPSESSSYEIAWRIGDWDLPKPEVPVPGTGANLFAALRALHCESDSFAAEHSIKEALGHEIIGLRGLGIEGVLRADRVCSDLVCLKNVSDFQSALSSQSMVLGATSALSSWMQPCDRLEFGAMERLLNVRQSCLRAERIRDQGEQIGDMINSRNHNSMQNETDFLLQLSRRARQLDQKQASMNAIVKARKVAGQTNVPQLRDEVAAEYARVLWTHGEHNIAIEGLKTALEAFTDDEEMFDGAIGRARRALLTAELGQSIATARSQQPLEIDKAYFANSLALAMKSSDVDTISNVCQKYATFADEQYRTLRDSTEIEDLTRFVNQREEEIRQNAAEMEKVDKRTSAYKQLNYHRNHAEKIVRQDRVLLRNLQDSRSHFLRQAVKMYADVLSRTDKQNDGVLRLTSLWLENSKDRGFNDEIAESLAKIPSHKFLPLAHQLSSRLSKVTDSEHPECTFQQRLFDVVTKMCKQHPFHSLYSIYALKNDNSSDSVSQSQASSSGKNSSAKQQLRGIAHSLRAEAAASVWRAVKQTSQHKERIADLEIACDAYVEWAEVNLRMTMPQLFTGGSIRKGPYRFPQNSSRLLIKTLRSMSIPVATADLTVDPTGLYADMVTIERYSDAFNTAGGLHLPKIIECIGSDGKRYKQLFKSEDDLRQDAVMQQIFRLLNNLLGNDRKAKQRQLKVRTYSVIPLGPQCGLLEFVGNTSPIGEVLQRTYEKNHEATSLQPYEARSELASCMGRSPQEKLEAYRSVCARMPPLFRTHFLDRFKDPPTWLAVRLNYTRSVATTSIIGYVLGLGDRHVSNILLDNVTGELVHIDFGVAFEQGKLLPIPELVPFRLTRNLVDAMGMSGVEGVYRRCCEETLRVLREHGSLTKTVLEVFKYDPLFVWTTNPVKVIRAQNQGDEGASAYPPSSSTGIARSKSTDKTNSKKANAASGAGHLVIGRGRETASLSAERAIQTVMTKLTSSLSVQYTVNELIRSATDEDNLSAIFHGWQAAL